MEGGVWVRNTRYPAVTSVRVVAAGEVPELGIRHGREIYELVSQREDLAYLNAPEKIPDEFCEA
nr:hypothetical protein [Methanoculleus sp. FWC-SCC1]